jgi:hypothetical protein
MRKVESLTVRFVVLIIKIACVVLSAFVSITLIYCYHTDQFALCLCCLLSAVSADSCNTGRKVNLRIVADDDCHVNVRPQVTVSHHCTMIKKLMDSSNSR